MSDTEGVARVARVASWIDYTHTHHISNVSWNSHAIGHVPDQFHCHFIPLFMTPIGQLHCLSPLSFPLRGLRILPGKVVLPFFWGF